MADRLKAKVTLIFFDEQPNEIVIKNMATREQIAFPCTNIDQIVSKLMEMEK